MPHLRPMASMTKEFQVKLSLLMPSAHSTQHACPEALNGKRKKSRFRMYNFKGSDCEKVHE